jgi:hypothetical protein
LAEKLGGDLQLLEDDAAGTVREAARDLGQDGLVGAQLALSRERHAVGRLALDLELAREVVVVPQDVLGRLGQVLEQHGHHCEICGLDTASSEGVGGGSACEVSRGSPCHPAAARRTPSEHTHINYKGVMVIVACHFLRFSPPFVVARLCATH